MNSNLATLDRSPHRYRRLSAVLLLAMMGCADAARAELHFSEVWGRSAMVQLAGIEPDRWVLATTDTDENALYTETNGPLGVTGVSVNDRPSIFLVAGIAANYDGTLGSAITGAPHDLDAGDWAFGMALLDWPGPAEFREPIVDAYFQLRLAGSSAVVQDTSLAEAAVAAGKWSSVDDYIEFAPDFAFYSANDDNPVGPSDYTGYVFPESSSVVLITLGTLIGLVFRVKWSGASLQVGRATRSAR